MAQFLIDEDMPRSLAPRLREAGFEATDVRDVGLRGAVDAAVFEYAVAHDFALISGDLGFSSILRFPLGSHAGILVARIPNEVPTREVNRLIVEAARDLSSDEIHGNLVILEPGRMRLRRAPEAPG